MLVERFGVVRRFLPQLCSTIRFGLQRKLRPVLDALRDLPGLLDSRPTKRVPTGYLDAEGVAVDVVPPSWRRLVFPPGRPDDAPMGH